MSDPIPDRIEVTFEMTADDDARYFAIRGKRESAWANRGSGDSLPKFRKR